MSKYKISIIGCGSILPRHLESIEINEDFELVALCDIQEDLVKSISENLKVKSFTNFKELIDSGITNFVTVSTPNSQHITQSIYALENGCDVLIEKPVSFTKEEVIKISDVAKRNNQKAYCVLQVRLNPTVSLLKEVLNLELLGKIRSVNLIQRWQRPYEYFNGWRSIPNVGGGTLYEVGIHYLDVIQNIFGKPNIHSSKIYSTKHTHVNIEDTIYSIFDFGDFGGTCEVTIAAEPRNLECSISVLGSNGFIKLGGKALNIIESANFLSQGCQNEYEKIIKKYKIDTHPNNYGSYQGSCPNHPYVYQNLNEFKIEETINVISMIDDIYQKSGIKYRIKNES
jgi:UDP-N-acetyl-2-amino-2-deoxyglucuronate dehydrogenase